MPQVGLRSGQDIRLAGAGTGWCLFEQSGWDVFSFSSVSPSFTLSKVSTDVCTEPFLAWNRSDTFADNCPIVTACCILMKAAYLFRLHLLKRRATGLYVYCFLMVLCYLSNFFHDRENEYGRNETYADQYTPYDPQRHISPNPRCYGCQIVSDSCCNEPTSHHHTFVFGRSHLRNKGNTHRRK